MNGKNEPVCVTGERYLNFLSNMEHAVESQYIVGCIYSQVVYTSNSWRTLPVSNIFSVTSTSSFKALHIDCAAMPEDVKNC